jgi:outer membrane biosynthesis protein TonB
MVAMLIRADSIAAPARVVRTSGINALDVASLEVVKEFRFSPGIYRGCPVWTFTQMPITWSPGPPPPGAF